MHKKVLIVFIILLLAANANAALLKLKSGNLVRGDIIEKTDRYVSFRTSFGVVIKYYLDEIESIDEAAVEANQTPLSEALDKMEEVVREEPIPAVIENKPALREAKPIPLPQPVVDEEVQAPTPTSPEVAATTPQEPMPPIGFNIYEVVPELRDTEKIRDESLEFDSPGKLDADSYYNLGVTAAEIAEYETAKINFLKAINLKPDFADALYNLGLVCGYLDDFEEAIEYFNKAIKINPLPADSYYSRGEAYAALKKYPEAKENFEKSIQIDPKFTPPYYKLGILLANQGDYMGAKEKLRKLIEIDPTSIKAFYQLGLISSGAGQNLEALGYFRKVAELEPNFPDVYYNMGVIYGISGQYDKAVDDFQQAVILGIKNPDAYYNLGMAHLGMAQKLEKPESVAMFLKARESLERAKALYSTETDYETIKRIDEILLDIPK